MPIDITPERLRTLFRPSAVALIGASDKSAFSTIAFDNLVRFGFTDRTHLVNRRGVEVHGRSTVTTCAEIGEPVDVAFLMVPQAGTLDALTDAASAGIRNAVVLSSGYGEAGEEGRRAERELTAHAERLGMVLLGPNHLGFANFVDGIPVTAVPGLPQTAGRTALLSQSGASSSAMVEFAAMVGTDLSYLVTLGNEAMITAGHALDFLVDDENTDSIAIFMETIREPEVFARAARRAAEVGKPIVVLKAGSSELSARTAAAHTGALVGDDKSISAVFAELGVIRVDSIEDMMITAGAAVKIGRVRAPGIGIVSISGGACDIVADRAQDVGAHIPRLSDDTLDRLTKILPTYGTAQNPFDLTGAAAFDPTMFTRAIEIMSQDPEVGVVAVVLGLPWESDGAPYMGQSLLNAVGAAQSDTPVALVNQVLQPVTEVSKAILLEARLSLVLPGLRQAVVALNNIARWSEAVDRIEAGPSEPLGAVRLEIKAPRIGSWSEDRARQLLTDAHIPVVPARLAASAFDAAQCATLWESPVAVKIVSPDILHKSDIGGVILGASGAAEVVSAYEAVRAAAATHAPSARIEGVLISPMRGRATELLVGIVRDPQWGLMIAVALGGIFVEILDDSALARLPIDTAGARRLVESLHGKAVLDGARGAAPVDLHLLAGVIARIGALAYALGDDLESLEINPLRVDGSTIEALDCVVTWANPQI